MHTPDSTEDELDALFRHGAEHYPEEMNLGAWMRMEQKLDADLMQRLVNRKVARLFAAEMAVVGVVLLLWLVFRPMWREPEAELGTAGKALTHRPAAAPASHGTATQEQTTGTKEREAEATPGVKVFSTHPVQTLPEAAGAVQAPAITAPSAAAAVGNPVRPVRKSRNLGLLPASVIHRPKAGVAAGTDNFSLLRTRGGSAATAVRQVAIAEPTGTAGGGAFHARSTKAAGPGSLPGLSATEAAVQGESAQPVSAARKPDRPENLGKDIYSQNVPPVSAQEAATVPDKHENGGSDAAITAEATAAVAALPAAADSAKTAVAPLVSPDSVEQPRRKALRPAHRLLVGVHYAPEVSTVGDAGYTRPGSQLGVQLEYRLTSRLRLTAGAFRTLKRYAARASDYTFPSQPPGSYPIDHIDATCRVTDIPLNLRYDVWQGKSGRAFVSGGLSSLLMRAEHYQYEYRYRGTYYSTGWSVFNGSNHWLGVVNLSAGYEQQLSSRWSVQAEPFVKLPLGGVGAGQVELRSAGLFLGLKYGL